MLKEMFQQRSSEALKARDNETRKVMGNILAEFLKVEKAGGFSGWTPAREEEVVRSYLKALQKSLETLGESPLAQEYRREYELLNGFLPKMPDLEQTRAIVTPYAQGAKGLGMFIGAVMKDHRGKVDPELVRTIGGELGLK